VWVPSEWNVKAFKDSGVKVPIYKIPHGIDCGMYNGLNPSQFEAFNAGEKTFNFYTVFQWNMRKNPEGLLRAYFNAFQGNDKVRLIMKTYIGGGLPQSEDARRIKEMISSLKQDMRLQHFPKLSLINDTLTSEQIRSLHMFGDAYVALPYGEGWGLGYMEAGLAGKPVIGTGAGGNMEFMTQENSFLVNNRETYVSGMGTFNPWYLGDQRWFQPDLIHAAEQMRYIYEHQDEARARGALLKKDIVTNFSWEKVANKMISRLKEI
jgi:glycosyltransferase involved in cell wall biosynthesis